MAITGYSASSSDGKRSVSAKAKWNWLSDTFTRPSSWGRGRMKQ